MKVEQTLGTLRFATGTTGTTVILGVFDVGTFRNQINGMFACKTFHTTGIVETHFFFLPVSSQVKRAFVTGSHLPSVARTH